MTITPQQQQELEQLRQLGYRLKIEVYDLEEKRRECEQAIAEKRADIQKIAARVRVLEQQVLPPPPGAPVIETAPVAEPAQEKQA